MGILTYLIVTGSIAGILFAVARYRLGKPDAFIHVPLDEIEAQGMVAFACMFASIFWGIAAIAIPFAAVTFAVSYVCHKIFADEENSDNRIFFSSDYHDTSKDNAIDPDDVPVEEAAIKYN